MYLLNILAFAVKLLSSSVYRWSYRYRLFQEMSSRTLRSHGIISSELQVESNKATDNKEIKKKSPRKRKEALQSEIKLENCDFNCDQNLIDLEVPKTKKKVGTIPQKIELISKIKVEVPETDQQVFDSVSDAKQTKQKVSKIKNVTKSIKKEKIEDDKNQELKIKDEKTRKNVKQSVAKNNKNSSLSPKLEKADEKDMIKDVFVKSEIKGTIGDIENGGWEPENWRKVWDNILEMRKLYVAPVDSLGCEECPEKGVAPEVFRYQTLISVMLSSQTKDQVTYAATQRLIEHGLNVDNILKTPDEKIGELIYPAGFWKSKVKFIKQTSQILKDQYCGDIPRTFKELCKLPGVGPKMANIVMSVGWKETVGIAVDTHVHRISNRLGWVQKPTKEAEQTRKALESWLPKKLWKDGSLHLVGFGQTVCKPVRPLCKDCFNLLLCPFGKSNKT